MIRLLGNRQRQMKSDNDLVEWFDVEQGSDEWRELRSGILTASRIAPITRGAEAKTRQRLLREMAAEIISGIPAESYSNAAMRRGNEMEPDAIAEYESRTGFIVERVGFVRRTIKTFVAPLIIGASPDGLAGKNGLVQIKTMQPDLMVAMIETNAVPLEHRPQCQAEMWVTGREWCDVAIFYRGMPVMPIHRFERDDIFIQELRQAAEVFDHELRQLVAKVKSKGGFK